MTPMDARSPVPAARSHRVLFSLLAGCWNGSVALMVAGLAVLLLVALESLGSPALALWAAAMGTVVLISLRTRPRGEPPGRLLTREEAPRLWDLVERCRRVAGIGPVGEIRLTATPNLGVTRVFRGGILYTRPVKVLFLGVPCLRSLTVPELAGALLHEFGHFAGDDVLRGEHMEVLEARLRNLRTSLDRTGLLKWCNPVYLWVRLYGAVFVAATARVRRRQEILADAMAARAVGSTVFARALVKAAALRRLFFRLAPRRVAARVAAGAPPANLYLDFREDVRRLSPADRRRILREVREAPEKAGSHHPPLAERLERLGRLWVPRRRRSEVRASVLVERLEGLEEELTPSVVRILAAMHVVRARRLGRDPIPAAAPTRSREPVGVGLFPRWSPAPGG